MVSTVTRKENGLQNINIINDLMFALSGVEITYDKWY